MGIYQFPYRVAGGREVGQRGYSMREVKSMIHTEHHRSHRSGWLRAAVMGANDGLVSTSSLILGVAAASTAHSDILLAGVAGLVAGAMSMAAGEYVSVSSQSDTEHADLELERKALTEHFDAELEELAAIYAARGLTPALATQVAEQLMASDALGAHARDEIGITDTSQARPLQAALASAATFTAGALWPLLIAWWAPPSLLIILVTLFSLLFLAFLGAAAARVGGAPILKASLRVMFWGALAMALTFGIGRLFGVVA